MRSQKILITGGRGQLGSAISEALKKAGYNVIPTGRKELNIENLDQVVHFVRQIRPDIVIHCAACTDVSLLERDRDLAYRVNSLGTRNVTVAAEEQGARLVYISSDYVFDGKGILEDGKKRPYREYDVAKPTNIYGKSKLEGENYVQMFHSRYYIIRTGWLYGAGANFVTRILGQIKSRDTLKVVHDQFGTPTSVLEVARMTKALIPTDSYGLYHGTCEGFCTWYEFAKEILSDFRISINVIPCTSVEFSSSVKRPQYSVLDNYILHIDNLYQFRHWKDSLKEWLKQG